MPGKGNPLLSVRLPQDLYDLLEQQIETSGKSKSDITIEALMAYLMPSEPESEMAQIKNRLQQLEAFTQSMRKHLPV